MGLINIMWERLTPAERTAAATCLVNELGECEAVIGAIEHGIKAAADELAANPQVIVTGAVTRPRQRRRTKAEMAAARSETLAGPNIPGSIGPEVRPPATAPSVSPFATN